VCIVSYAVPPELLSRHVPHGLTLETRDGHAFVSLVAFDFDEVRVRGIPIPGYRSFPEVNLRYYVRCGRDRGVVFIREFVPKRMVAWIAKAVYNEPYEALRMTSDVHRVSEGLTVEHKFHAAGHTQKVTLTATRDPPQLPPESSDDHFFKEHEWGFGVDRRGRLLRYRVAHPPWLTYRLAWHDVKVDWKRVYGAEWGVLKHAKPCSVVLAEGSPITVFDKAPVQRISN
jgi:uncharacterized protein YqjF (DUF2071 family)